MTSIQFYATGLPAPQGSKKAFYNPRIGRVQVVEDSKKTKPWRHDVMAAAFDHIGDQQWTPVDHAVRIHLEFYFPRPKAHFRTGRNQHLLRDGAPSMHTTKPDLDKLVRSTFDALTAAGVWRDDKLAADVHAVKRYCDHRHPVAGCLVTIHAAPAAQFVGPVQEVLL